MRACLLKEFILLGHENARPKLYDLCRLSPDSNNIVAISEVIEVDGEKGLLFAARALGEALLADSDFWVGDWELWRFDDLHGPGQAKEILAKVSSTDFVIRHYLQEVAAYERRKSDGASSEKKVPEPVESVVEAILSATERVSRLRRWGNEASPEERAQVGKLLEGEPEVGVLRNVLWCLKGKGLADYDETLLTLVFHEDDEVRYFAGQMFSHHVNPQVRAAGFALLERGDAAVATDLLRLNVTEHDAGRILDALRRSKEEDNHCTVVNLLEMLENGSPWGPAIPLYIYEHSPCMHCREHAVEFLIKNQICPQWVLEEAAFDGSEDIRKMVAEVKA
ncbi:MAG: hypothetical protein EOP83_19500 [Verrucomicrobiaceae bacterium]|nr:MAG: hypothetical protein EOP83_19500 [Verrucomicrobiaceae bacterium]